MEDLNKHILLVMKWLDDPESVSKDELEENRMDAATAATASADAASAAATAVYAYAYAYADAVAAAADAEKWVSKYFERSGENKQDYIDVIESGKAPKEPAQEWVDGLPPVGCDCLTLHKGDLVECLYVGKGIGEEYIYQITSGCYRGEIDRLIGSPKFRPLKTQEQKDREAFIERCVKLTEMDGKLAIEGFGMIYDNDARFKASEGE